VFGALSAVPLILAWLYACWAVLLLGAEVAFATQNLPFARREMRQGATNAAEEEAVALEIAHQIALRFQGRRPAPSAEALADALDEPVRLVRRLIDRLVEADLVRPVQTENERDPAYLPAAPLARISIGDVLRATRGELAGETDRRVQRSPEIARALSRLDGAWRRVADDTTLATLCEEPRSPGEASGA
jgi:membrane protein